MRAQKYGRNEKKKTKSKLNTIEMMSVVDPENMPENRKCFQSSNQMQIIYRPGTVDVVYLPVVYPYVVHL